MVLATKLRIKLNFKVQFIDITFGANVNKEKLLSVWSEKTCSVCVIYIECVVVLYFCTGMMNG